MFPVGFLRAKKIACKNWQKHATSDSQWREYCSEEKSDPCTGRLAGGNAGGQERDEQRDSVTGFSLI